MRSVLTRSNKVFRYTEDGVLFTPLRTLTSQSRLQRDSYFFTPSGRYDPLWGQPQPNQVRGEYGDEIGQYDRGMPVPNVLRLKSDYDPADVARLYRWTCRLLHDTASIPYRAEYVYGDRAIARRAVEATYAVKDKEMLIYLMNNWRKKLHLSKTYRGPRPRNLTSVGGPEWQRYYIDHPDAPGVFPHGV